MRSALVRAVLCLLFLSGCVAAQLSSTAQLDALRTAELTADVKGTSPWLAELNKWREMAGLRPVGENADFSSGSQEHAVYLEENEPRDPAGFRYYSRTLGGGRRPAASGGGFFYGEGAGEREVRLLKTGVMQAVAVAFGKDPIDDIDQWVAGPFHRLPLLAPWVEVAGYGSSGTYPRRVGVLSLRGIAHAGDVRELEFPPDGSAPTIDTMRAGEWPNPLPICAGYSSPVGLPVTLEFGDGRAAELYSYTLRDETQGRDLESCGFDGDNYRNPNPPAQRVGRDALNRFGALVVIPRYPLQSGHRYAVSIVARAKHYDWTFRIESNPASAGVESTMAR